MGLSRLESLAAIEGALRGLNESSKRREDLQTAQAKLKMESDLNNALIKKHEADLKLKEFDLRHKPEELAMEKEMLELARKDIKIKEEAKALAFVSARAKQAEDERKVTETFLKTQKFIKDLNPPGLWDTQEEKQSYYEKLRDRAAGGESEIQTDADLIARMKQGKI